MRLMCALKLLVLLVGLLICFLLLFLAFILVLAFSPNRCPMDNKHRCSQSGPYPSSVVYHMEEDEHVCIMREFVWAGQSGESGLSQLLFFILLCESNGDRRKIRKRSLKAS